MRLRGAGVGGGRLFTDVAQYISSPGKLTPSTEGARVLSYVSNKGKCGAKGYDPDKGHDSVIIGA